MTETNQIAAPSHTNVGPFEQKNLKFYHHFDAVLNIQQANALDLSPQRISAHKFLPLLRYNEEWRRAPKRFRVLDNGKIVWKTESRSPKKRPISYASHKDSLIYKLYREKLSIQYERYLHRRKIDDCVVAYRKIPKADGEGNKSNIEISNEAFERISDLGDCCAVAIDISDFFGSIDHALLRTKLCEVLGVVALSDDWNAIFRSITWYRYVLLKDAFVALGYSYYNAQKKLRFRVSPKDISKQICTNKQFREKIVSGKLIKKNRDDNGNLLKRGIPQGTPISDIFANLFLSDVDVLLKAYTASKGGYYYRYSDDILLILPGDGRAARAAETFAMSNLKKFSEHLRVNPAKTEVAIFRGGVAKYSLHNVRGTTIRARNYVKPGLRYLGFKFDGENVFIRESTITNLRRKVIKRTKAMTFNYIARYSGKSDSWLKNNLPEADFKEAFMQMDMEPSPSLVANLGVERTDKRNFYSYALRASKSFPRFRQDFKKQLRGIKKLVSLVAHETFDIGLPQKSNLKRKP